MKRCRTCRQERETDPYFTLPDGRSSDECAICRLDRKTKARGRAIGEQIWEQRREGFLGLARRYGVDKLLEWGRLDPALTVIEDGCMNFPDVDLREILRGALIELFDLEDQP